MGSKKTRLITFALSEVFDIGNVVDLVWRAAWVPRIDSVGYTENRDMAGLKMPRLLVRLRLAQTSIRRASRFSRLPAHWPLQPHQILPPFVLSRLHEGSGITSTSINHIFRSLRTNFCDPRNVLEAKAHTSRARLPDVAPQSWVSSALASEEIHHIISTNMLHKMIIADIHIQRPRPKIRRCPSGLSYKMRVCRLGILQEYYR